MSSPSYVLFVARDTSAFRRQLFDFRVTLLLGVTVALPLGRSDSYHWVRSYHYDCDPIRQDVCLPLPYGIVDGAGWPGLAKTTAGLFVCVYVCMCV